MVIATQQHHGRDNGADLLGWMNFSLMHLFGNLDYVSLGVNNILRQAYVVQAKLGQNRYQLVVDNRVQLASQAAVVL